MLAAVEERAALCHQGGRKEDAYQEGWTNDSPAVFSCFPSMGKGNAL